MTQRDRDFEEMLRRTLHAAAESVEPADDGLQRIRARLTAPRPLLAAWVMAGYSAGASRALSALLAISAWLRGVRRAVNERLRAAGWSPSQPSHFHSWQKVLAEFGPSSRGSEPDHKG